MTVGHSGRMKQHGFTPEQTKSLRERVKFGDFASLQRWYEECGKILASLYDKPELTHIGDKNPYFHTSPGFMKAICKLPKVWTIRDPRDVWFSGKSKKKDYLGPYLANVRNYFARKDETTLVIRFEDLVLNPQPTMDKVHEFLGLSSDTSFLNRQPNKYDRRFKWNPNSLDDFDPAQLKKWEGTSVPKKILNNAEVQKILKTFY